MLSVTNIYVKITEEKHMTNFLKLINEENSAIILDIDKTLVVPRNIFIYRRKPEDKQEVPLTPEQYAKETVSADSRKYYDYRDFRNAEKVAGSIKTGLPIVSNLKIMDDYISKGWKVGILTARGMEDVVLETMKSWLKYKNKKGDLKDIGDKLVRGIVNAVNDDSKSYSGVTDFEKKSNIIRKLSKQYDRLIFIDDDLNTIKAIKKMLRKENIKNVFVRLATGE
tara:strand:+ start:36 stop:707 length:672 start_codon:yes stop_codon:yes gene_type:complete